MELESGRWATTRGFESLRFRAVPLTSRFSGCIDLLLVAVNEHRRTSQLSTTSSALMTWVSGMSMLSGVHQEDHEELTTSLSIMPVR